MRTAIIRWTIYLIALLIAGPGAGMLVGSVHGADGGPASPLVSAAPMMGLAAGVAALAIALLVGVVAARLLGMAPAMTAAGIVVAWAAWKTAGTDQLIRTANSGKPLGTMAVEGLILGVLGLIVALACWKFGQPVDNRDPSVKTTADKVAASAQASSDSIAEQRAVRDREGSIPWLFKKLFTGKNGPLSIAIGIVAGGVAAWLIGATPLKGQAVFAAIAAGTFAAAACRLVDFEAPMPAMFIPLVILAILGPLSGLAMGGTGGIVATAYRGALFPLANISALDWIAGGLLGIPIGVSWAGSMIEKRMQEA